jgi:hypothetical protein
MIHKRQEIEMTDRLMVSIGGWVTIQAEGMFALGATLLITVFLGALWFAAQSKPTKNSRSG